MDTADKGSGRSQDRCTFFAIGDWGDRRPELHQTAKAMANYVEKYCVSLDFILALGDNFYPYGVESVEDKHFQETWAGVFLKHKALRVPWRAILGNHDYMGNPQAQVDFTFSKSNVDNLWQMPARNYSWTFPGRFKLPAAGAASQPLQFHDADGEEKEEEISKAQQQGSKGGRGGGPGEEEAAKDLKKKIPLVAFFGIDSNGAQGHVRRSHPEQRLQTARNIEWLRKGLQSSNAVWKVAFAHHPMYTKGHTHSTVARCLRDAEYKSRHSKQNHKGYDLERVAVDGGVSCYITGHEHIMQWKYAKGISHCVVGASGGGDVRFYGGITSSDDDDGETSSKEVRGLVEASSKPKKNSWHDNTEAMFGFVVIEIDFEKMVTTFVDAATGEIMKQVTQERSGER